MMAWLRAWVLGVPAAQAGRHYASDQVGADRRTARGYLHRLLARLWRAAGELRERELAIAYIEEFLQSRRSEPGNLSFGMIEPAREGNQLTGAMKIQVLGKGRKLREVPLKDVTLQALEDHYADRIALVDAGVLPAHFNHIPKADTPLLSILRQVRANGRQERATAPPQRRAG
jgi:hypothetical protein